MADAAVTMLLENLSYLLTSCADLVSGAEDEIQQLKNEVELLKVFLQDGANKLKKEEPFPDVGRQIQEVVYGAELMIDAHLSRAAAARGKIDLFRRHRALDTEPAHSLAEEVRSLREDKIKPMLEKARVDFADLLLIGDGSETILEEPHQIEVNKVPSIGQDKVVGVEDELEIITSCMMESTLKKNTGKLEVISIVGMAGLGKTTLARRLYQTPQMQYVFPTRIWVYVSRNLNLKDVFLTILKEVSSKDMSSMSDHDLAIVVRDFLEKRRFLIVLDDVWDRDHFTAIRDALPESNRMSSRVLVTTRFEKVGLHCNPARPPHKLRFLSSEESWELLQLEVFGKLESCPVELMDAGKEIADWCDGLPLIIVIMAGILSDELSKIQSMNSLKNEWMELSESCRFGRHDDIIEMSVILSYRRLAEELRNSFLYLGVFPEDYKIPATTLTRLWIAEGFIQQKEGRSLEDVAEENLNRLIGRKLVLVDEIGSNGKVKACRLHDEVRDFCITEGHRVNLFQEIRNPKQGTFDPPISDLQRHRRLCIYTNPLDFFCPELYVPDVRSFSCFSKNETILLPEDTSKIPGDAFKLLRVLDIKPIRFTRFPLQLTQLFCLRYIVLSSDFKILPEVVSMLRNIQTLVILTTSRTLEIKADIWKMNRLRHVKTNASIILRKEPDDRSDQELQTLANLSPQNCTNNVFHRTRWLKKLGIRGILSKLFDGETGSRNFDNLEILVNLENLKLLNDVHMVSPSEGRLPCLPPPEKFPPKLKSLTLSATFLSWEHMSVLGMLEKLEILKLKDNAFVGECWEVADGSFPSLRVLQIGYTNLVSWKATGDHFPRLRSLALRNCENLENLPQGLEIVENLEEIELLRPSIIVAVSARRIEANTGIKLSMYFPPGPGE